MKNHNIKGIEKLTDNNFLNLFNIRYEDINYYVASRRKNVKDMAVNNVGNQVKADAIIVLPVFANNDIVLIKQFRPAINDYIYELPAGLVDDNETEEDAVKRELFEETGLTAVDIFRIMKPSYTSVGMSDETVAAYAVLVDGDISSEYCEGNEDIEPFILKAIDIDKFLDENNVCAKTSLLLNTVSLIINE